MSRFEKFIAATWNRLVSRRTRAWRTNDLDLGLLVSDGQITNKHIALSQVKRREHIAIEGKTGTGKTSLMLCLCEQDVRALRGFIFFALHGDVIPFLVSAIASLERESNADLSERLIIVDPTDPDFSIGLNVLEQQGTGSIIRAIEEVTEVLRVRWQLDHFGARTEELLRNALYVLAFHGYTLLELAPFLTHDSFRDASIAKLPDGETKQYFQWRYDPASEAMRRVMAEPILNKISAFTANPFFRHIVGQPNSTFSLRDAMDQGKWILVKLDKGFLGENALTLGSLLLTMVKNTLFGRKNRDLFSVYLDEVQNFVSHAGSLETILAEARKQGVGVVTANQYLDQLPADMRSAILAVGTQVFFQLSSPDARDISAALDGGKPLGEALKNLRQRHMIVKSGHERWREVVVPTVRKPEADYTDLWNRSRTAWARSREAIERQISNRLESIYRKTDEVAQ